MTKTFIQKFKKSGSQKFLVKLCIFFILLFVLDFIIGSSLNIFYFKQKVGFLYRTTYAIEKTREDVLIFGSSAATHDYYTSIFEEQLKMSSYNVGIDGNSIFYDYAILKLLLKRYHPKIIVLDFDINELKKTKESYERLSSLLPYYKNYPEVRSIIDLKSPDEKIKLLSKIYPYNSTIFSIISGNIKLFNIEYLNKRQEKKDFNIKGYFPLTTVWDKPLKADSSSINYETDSNKVKMYTSFITDCINSKVELYIVCAPVYIKQNYVNPSVILGRAIANKYNIKFWDYSADSEILSNSKLFADIPHLNESGAKIFSIKIAEAIEKASKKLK